MNVRRVAALSGGAVLLGTGALGVGLSTGAPPMASLRAPELERSMPGTLQEGTARQVVTSDSVTLQGQQFLAPSRGTVILLHGLGEHDSSYTRGAAPLAAASGMNVVAFTLRGNGYGSPAPGDVSDTDAYLRDIAGLVRELRRRTPSGPVLLVGVRQGAGLAARYAGHVDKLQLPAVQGVALIHPTTSLDALQTEPIGHASPVEWHARRLTILRALDRASITLLDGLPVAHQQAQGANGVAVRHYTFRAIRALGVETTWRSLRDATIPTLVLSAERPDAADYRRTDRAEWSGLPTDAGLGSAEARAALAAWTAQFSADAAMPPAVLPYQSLPILPPKE